MSDPNPQDYIAATDLAGVYIVERPTFPDGRGFFHETFRKNDLEARFGSSLDFVQANHSRSVQNTLRGIHIAPWHKLISVTRGEIQAVISDLRPHSPTFGQSLSFNLGESTRASIFIPAGCGNSFAVLSEEADYVYLVTDYWAPGKETSVRYDDLDLAIPWQVSQPIVSEQDKAHPTAREAFPDQFSN
jgi:dTDP-4-dehydrorhamnose 3,5-epimerase